MLNDSIPADVAFFGSWWRRLEPCRCKPPLPRGLPLEPTGTQPTGINIQWDHYRILRSGPPVPGCYNGEIQSCYAKSGPFPDHFLNFSGHLVILFV